MLNFLLRYPQTYCFSTFVTLKPTVVPAKFLSNLLLVTLKPTVCLWKTRRILLRYPQTYCFVTLKPTASLPSNLLVPPEELGRTCFANIKPTDISPNGGICRCSKESSEKLDRQEKLGRQVKEKIIAQCGGSGGIDRFCRWISGYSSPSAKPDGKSPGSSMPPAATGSRRIIWKPICARI